MMMMMMMMIMELVGGGGRGTGGSKVHYGRRRDVQAVNKRFTERR